MHFEEIILDKNVSLVSACEHCTFICIHLFNVSGIFVSLLCLLVVLMLQVLYRPSQLLYHQQLRIVSLNQDLNNRKISMIEKEK